ncbi:GNAT family N-acetyltransferase [Nesterenkonia sp. K-15-9-6]|uniref:GNAT family N-acetyltransferase n=1 Tax=Nesterenkonia sp. K-15-9-6 TaxID=3093918 RepID=UPI004044ABBE
MTYTITSRMGRYSESDDITHIWEATDEGQVIGALYVTTDTQEVAQIEVDADRRREGIATALWEAATAEMDVFHAYEAHRTPEGAAFAQAVGGEEIETCEISHCYCTQD